MTEGCLDKNLGDFSAAVHQWSGAPTEESLLIERHADIDVFYAPFEFVNLSARIILVGITPGADQAKMALHTAKVALGQGLEFQTATEKAKATASFSGIMRDNLCLMFDYIGLSSKLGLDKGTDLFGTAANLVHYTSVLRYPVYVDGKNYKGTKPSITGDPFLWKYAAELLAEELNSIPSAIVIPLGGAPNRAIKKLIKHGCVKNPALFDLYHPSRENTNLIRVFCDVAPMSGLNTKRFRAANPGDLIEEKRRTLLHAVNSIFPGN